MRNFSFRELYCPSTTGKIMHLNLILGPKINTCIKIYLNITNKIQGSRWFVNLMGATTNQMHTENSIPINQYFSQLFAHQENIQHYQLTDIFFFKFFNGSDRFREYLSYAYG